MESQAQLPPEKRKLLPTPLLLFIGTMILANIAGRMESSLLPLYLQELDASVKQIGLFFTFSAFMPLLFRIFGGWLSDMIGRLQAVAIGSIAGVIAYGIMLTATSWEWLLIAAVARAVTRSFIGPSYQAYIAEQADPDQLARTYAISDSMFMIVGVIGPITGGIITDQYSFKTMWLVAAIIYSVAAVIRIGMAIKERQRRRTAIQSKQEKPSFGKFKESLAAMVSLLFGGGVVTWIFITDGLKDIAIRLPEELTPLYVQNIYDLSTTQVGMLAAASALAMVIGLNFTGAFADKRGENRSIVIGIAVYAIGQVVFVLSTSFYGFIGARALQGLGIAFIRPAYSALISKSVPENKRGLAFAIFRTSIGVFSLPAPYIGGLLWEQFSPQTPFAVTIPLLVLLMPLVWFKLKPSASQLKEA